MRLFANLYLRFREARLPDTHRFREFGDQELILIGRAHFSGVGDPKGLHRPRGGGTGLTGSLAVGISACSCATVTLPLNQSNYFGASLLAAGQE